MPSYKAPLREINFVFNELLDSDSHYKSLGGCEALSSELLDAIAGSAGKFAENIVAPDLLSFLTPIAKAFCTETMVALSEDEFAF
jgi:hypothetical protein